ncbi:unnamed protein product [Phytophthora lilii]|uniref:Unnamed protein product n=1 Tax=Phytophthora lilii TaxID=2077276 RepID=A0A9W6U3D6_9STRA|nr:unnamed protein product [Phytophthora lilii]
MNTVVPVSPLDGIGREFARITAPQSAAQEVRTAMSGQMRALGALRRGALTLRRSPLSGGHHPLRLRSVQAAFPAVGAALPLDNRRFSTSNAAPPTLELTMADGQLTGGGIGTLGRGGCQLTNGCVAASADVAAAVAGSGTGHEPWAIVQGVQTVLEAVHTTTGLPWWATLLVGARATEPRGWGAVGLTDVHCFFGGTGLGRHGARSHLPILRVPDPGNAEVDAGEAGFREAVLGVQVRAYIHGRTIWRCWWGYIGLTWRDDLVQPSSDHKGHLDAMLLGRQGVKAVMKKFNTRPFQTIMGSIAYIPVFMVMAYSARDMVRSGNFAGFESGGLLFWKNLMETDSTFVLPVLAAASTYGNMEMSVQTKSGIWTKLLQAGQYGTIAAVPFLVTLPQGVFFYWLGASWSSMAQMIAMNNNNFRRSIGLRPRVKETQSPAAAAAEMLGKDQDKTGGATVVSTPATTKQQ